MSIFDIDRPPSKKEKKRRVLKENITKHEAALNEFAWEQRLMGSEVTLTGKGSDVKVTKRHILTGEKLGSRLVDIKTGGGQASPLQKKKRAKIVRRDPLFY